MKKIRGFRLGRRLVRLWRWARRPWAKPTAYLRLTATPSPSPGDSPPRRLPNQHHGEARRETTTSVIAHWGHRLARRLCRSTPRVSLGGTGGAESCHGRLLGADWRKQQQEAAAARSKPPPKGHLVVYVGRKGVDPLYRFLVPVVYFNHPLFGELLRGAEEEFGFHQAGGITIPCPIADFESVRTRVAAAAGVSCRHCGRPA